MNASSSPSARGHRLATIPEPPGPTPSILHTVDLEVFLRSVIPLGSEEPGRRRNQARTAKRPFSTICSGLACLDNGSHPFRFSFRAAFTRPVALINLVAIVFVAHNLSSHATLMRASQF